MVFVCGGVILYICLLLLLLWMMTISSTTMINDDDDDDVCNWMVHDLIFIGKMISGTVTSTAASTSTPNISVSQNRHEIGENRSVLFDSICNFDKSALKKLT